jgi:murein peptide amidase A
VRDAVLGRSAEGRPVRVSVVGDPASPARVLVVGAVHGTETAGRAVAGALRRRPPNLPGVALWIVRDLNPDGSAAGTRQNARGVDLNRNFPDAWRPEGRPFDTFHAGARALSEPESRMLARLVGRLRPDLTIWYHQALALVDLGTARRPALPRTYARASGLPVARLGFLPGIATRWQNRAHGGSAFVVELPGGALTAAAAARHARAVVVTARTAARGPLVRRSPPAAA